MIATRTAIGRWRQLIVLLAPMACTHAPRPDAVPTLREYFQGLVKYNGSPLSPKRDNLFKLEETIITVPPESISEALPAIRITLEHRDDNVKFDAALALMGISLRPDSAVLLKNDIVAISRLFDSSNPHLQATPMMILQNLRPEPPPTVVPLLLAFLKRTDRDATAQSSAIFSLIRLAPENPQVEAVYVEFFSRLLDPNTRISTLNALPVHRITDSRIISAVISSLHDPDFYVRSTAFQVLRGIGPAAMQQGRPALQKAHGDFLALLRRVDGDVSQQEWVISMLLQDTPDDPEVVGAVVDYFSRAPRARSAALNGLRYCHSKDPRLVGLVIAYLHDSNHLVRTKAAYVLKDMGPLALVRARPELEKLVQDPHQPADVKEGATRALHELHPYAVER